ncbi:MAG: cell division protein FtsQ/DivIB [Thermomicrobiales bacterium]
MARGVTAKRVGQACIHTLRWMVVMLRNGRLPAGAGALALAAILTYVVTDARFSVDTVVVTGVASLPGSTVAEASGVLGESVFRVDSAAVARRVAALPGLQHVEVVTEAPDRLIVHVTERQPVMIWDAGDASFLVDEAGDVLGQADASNPLVLPRLQALPGNRSPVVGGKVDVMPVRAVLALNARLPVEAGLTQAAITFDPVMGVTVQTEKWRAVVGNDELLGKKLAILKLLLRDQTWSDADIRDPDRPVMHKR